MTTRARGITSAITHISVFQLVTPNARLRLIETQSSRAKQSYKKTPKSQCSSKAAASLLWLFWATRRRRARMTSRIYQCRFHGRPVADASRRLARPRPQREPNFVVIDLAARAVAAPHQLIPRRWLNSQGKPRCENEVVINATKNCVGDAKTKCPQYCDTACEDYVAEILIGAPGDALPSLADHKLTSDPATKQLNVTLVVDVALVKTSKTQFKRSRTRSARSARTCPGASPTRTTTPSSTASASDRRRRRRRYRSR